MRRGRLGILLACVLLRAAAPFGLSAAGSSRCANRRGAV